VTTNETYFYRGESHFAALRQTILPELLARKGKARMWSVGCSTGEEAYTMAMVALETAPRRESPVEILATDISTAVVARARQGVYEGRALRCLPPPYREAYFERTEKGEHRVCEKVRSLVRFSVHNALRDEPPARGLDVIFCRNLMIYFDSPTQKRLVDEKFAPALDARGYLFIGHSESLIGKSRAFAFRRVDRAHVYRLAELEDAG
jgi:chemotaxis protein methyltransferase CheR